VSEDARLATPFRHRTRRLVRARWEHGRLQRSTPVVAVHCSRVPRHLWLSGHTYEREAAGVAEGVIFRRAIRPGATADADALDVGYGDGLAPGVAGDGARNTIRRESAEQTGSARAKLHNRDGVPAWPLQTKSVLPCRSKARALGLGAEKGPWDSPSPRSSQRPFRAGIDDTEIVTPCVRHHDMPPVGRRGQSRGMEPVNDLSEHAPVVQVDHRHEPSLANMPTGSTRHQRAAPGQPVRESAIRPAPAPITPRRLVPDENNVVGRDTHIEPPPQPSGRGHQTRRAVA